MRAAIFLLCLLTPTLPALAGEWIWLGANMNGIVYYDNALIKAAAKDTFKVWVKNVPTESMLAEMAAQNQKLAGLVYSKDLMTIDCAEGLYRLNHRLYYGPSDRVIDQLFPDFSQSKPKPGSIMESLVREVCRR